MPSRESTEEDLKLNTLVIEQGVPLRPRYPHGAFTKLASKMIIGDSIYCSDSRQITGLAMALQKQNKGYETRKEGEGRRIWRVR